MLAIQPVPGADQLSDARRVAEPEAGEIEPDFGDTACDRRIEHGAQGTGARDVEFADHHDPGGAVGKFERGMEQRLILEIASRECRFRIRNFAASRRLAGVPPAIRRGLRGTEANHRARDYGPMSDRSGSVKSVAF